jgi:hypothetical protein
MNKLGGAGFLLALVCGCEDPYEPNYLFRGEWIDIDGRGRTAQETCGGTFEYVDAYAGALAVEFGVREHLGSYRWYSPEQYEAELPCAPLDEAYACAFDDGILHTPLIPHEHEMVHLADFAAGNCPDALGEGLAEFYSTLGDDATSSDFERLAARLKVPTGHPPHAEYGILGRFAGYLVNRFGLQAVLDICRITGRYPDEAQFSTAMESVLGVSVTQLLADFEPELGSCNASKYYQSRVFACGAAEAAPNAGVVSESTSIERTFTLDCANDMTIGPVGDQIWIVERIDLDADATYLISMDGEGDGVEIAEVELVLAKCEPCGTVRTLAGDFIGPEDFDAGRYSLELRAPADFVGSVTVTISR